MHREKLFVMMDVTRYCLYRFIPDLAWSFAPAKKEKEVQKSRDNDLTVLPTVNVTVFRFKVEAYLVFFTGTIQTTN